MLLLSIYKQVNIYSCCHELLVVHNKETFFISFLIAIATCVDVIVYIVTFSETQHFVDNLTIEHYLFLLCQPTFIANYKVVHCYLYLDNVGLYIEPTP